MTTRILRMVLTIVGAALGATLVFIAPRGVRVVLDASVVAGMTWMAWTLGHDAARRIRLLGWPGARRSIVPHVVLTIAGFCMAALSTLLLLVEARLLPGVQ